VGICTKIAKQMDAQGIDKVFETAETVKQTLLDTKPLLKQVKCLGVPQHLLIHVQTTAFATTAHIKLP
jgi:hypothetical protein